MRITKYWWVGLVVVIIGTSLTCDITRTISFNKIAGQLPQAEADAKRLGLPLSGAELMRNPPVKPENNAKPLLDEATAALKAARKLDDNWRTTVTNALIDQDAASLAKAEEWMRKLGPAIDLAAKAAAKPDADMGRNWATANPASMTTPELAYIKEFGSALGLRGALRAKQGDKEGAIWDFRACLRLARLASTEPMALDAMVRIAVESYAFRGMETAATFAPKDTKFLAELDQLTAEHAEEPLDFDNMLRGEIWMGVFLAERSPKQISADLLAGLERAGQTNMFDAYLLEKTMEAQGVPDDLRKRAYRSYFLIAWVDFLDTKAENETRLQRYQRFEKWAHKYADNKASVADLNAMLIMPYSVMGRTLARSEAKPIVFRGLMAAMMHRAKKGAWPSTLKEAGFEEKDYFTGEPLRMVVDGDSVKVYSVDWDLKDDQGKEVIANSQNREETRDLACTFPRQIRSSRMEN